MDNNRAFFVNLDALRWFAALGVITAHMAGWLHWPATEINKWIRIVITLDGSSGKAGVSFFFTLSGFLITYLMFEERRLTLSFHIGNFYLRRILRIWPLYFLTLVIGFILSPFVFSVAEGVADWKLYALFLSNFDNLYNGFPTNGILGVQWSVAVEEQFYLFWPWVFLFFGSGARFVWACIVTVAASVAFHFLDGSQFHTLSAMNQLASGALLAYVAFHHQPKLDLFFARISKTWTLVVYVAGVLLILSDYRVTRVFPAFSRIDDFLQSLFFVFVIAEQNYSSASFVKLGSIPVFNALGKISYGLYLLHMVAIFFVLRLNESIPLPVLVNAALVLISTVLLAAVSYRFLERPFLHLKDRIKMKMGAGNLPSRAVGKN